MAYGKKTENYPDILNCLGHMRRRKVSGNRIAKYPALCKRKSVYETKNMDIMIMKIPVA